MGAAGSAWSGQMPGRLRLKDRLPENSRESIRPRLPRPDSELWACTGRGRSPGVSPTGTGGLAVAPSPSEGAGDILAAPGPPGVSAGTRRLALVTGVLPGLESVLYRALSAAGAAVAGACDAARTPVGASACVAAVVAGTSRRGSGTLSGATAGARARGLPEDARDDARCAVCTMPNRGAAPSSWTVAAASAGGAAVARALPPARVPPSSTPPPSLLRFCSPDSRGGGASGAPEPPGLAGGLGPAGLGGGSRPVPWMFTGATRSTLARARVGVGGFTRARAPNMSSPDSWRSGGAGAVGPVSGHALRNAPGARELTDGEPCSP
mmetsp:Transcript_5052/g.14882  ORF Transcript_5052/g.14882 Transcript_5052/m.14882 type:complete len:323 (+) Transcript_5052:2018-2986(+)